jgi:hypothetical protein
LNNIYPEVEQVPIINRPPFNTYYSKLKEIDKVMIIAAQQGNEMQVVAKKDMIA